MLSWVSSSFHPRPTPRAVAREAGGRWCVPSSSSSPPRPSSFPRPRPPPVLVPPSSLFPPRCFRVLVVLPSSSFPGPGWCSRRPAFAPSCRRRPPSLVVPLLVVSPVLVLVSRSRPLAPRLHPASSCSRRCLGVLWSCGRRGGGGPPLLVVVLTPLPLVAPPFHPASSCSRR